MNDRDDQRRLLRVRGWLDRMVVLTDATHPLGRRALRELPSATGLSPEQVAWGMSHAFEVDASEDDLRQLVANTSAARAAHVLLSANVFVGALRAIAIAVASAERVSVRASRREPLTAALLHAAAPEAFTPTPTLAAAAGDHVWAYGADTTLSRLREELPAGVVLHGHGSGFGVLYVDEADGLTISDYDAIALDIAAFDQRGCLSPRFVLFEAERRLAPKFARCLLEAMNRIARVLPAGAIDQDTARAAVRHRETWRYLGEVFEGNGGLVSLDCERLPWGTPPSGRIVHVRWTDDALSDLVGLGHAVTAVGSRADAALSQAVQSHCPGVRWSPFGRMQRPRLDGPADRRAAPAGVLL